MLFEISFALAWLLAIVQGLMILAFMWVIGRLKQQYDSTFQPLMTDDGPPVLGYAPDLEFADVQTGRRWSGLSYFKEGTAVVLFVTQSCRPCREILDSAARFQRSWLRPVRFLLVVRGDEAAVEAYARTYPQFDVASDVDGSIAAAYGIARWPYGILVAHTGIVRNKGVVNTPQHLEGLALGRGKPIERVSVHPVAPAPEDGELVGSAAAE